ncbi:cytochrome c oxidase subunit II [Natronoglomus mannanivorans]|uniref:cytochrome c oxidase subunit II n=1 Tax=Natronoglomus mannanivorans TaxID=2979990 RepID=UPI003CCE034D
MPLQTRAEVFEQIFIIFLGLGTLVGIIVVSYTLYNAYKYRDSEGPTDDEDVPTLGELPTGGKGGKKLFVSFGLSAIIVLGLVLWTYTWLIYVETGPEGDNPGEDALEVDVEGQAFSWTFAYENGVETSSADQGMVVPEDTAIWVNVTSTDVWHAFGVPDQRVKADAIPGESDVTWFATDPLEEGDGDQVVYEDGIECFELCGAGHSNMKSDITVMEEEAFEEWLAEEEAAMEEEEEEDEAEDDANGDEDDDANDEGGDA